MRPGPVLSMVIAGAAIGWLLPGAGPSTAVPQTRSSAGEADTPRRPSRREAWLTGETALDRQPDGHFYADAQVESREVRFLVDTGASIVALTAADAEAAGLDWSESDLVRIGRGANGDVYGVPVTLDRVELGGFEARGVEAAIIPEGLDTSLLGQSFLSRLRGVSIEGDRMLLGG